MVGAIIGGGDTQSLLAAKNKFQIFALLGDYECKNFGCEPSRRRPKIIVIAGSIRATLMVAFGFCANEKLLPSNILTMCN